MQGLELVTLNMTSLHIAVVLNASFAKSPGLISNHIYVIVTMVEAQRADVVQ